MPSYIRQGLTIFSIKNKRKKNNKDLDFVFIRKTGYYNIWIDGTHYYYSSAKDVDEVNTNNLSNAFNSWNPPPRGTIVITRK